MQLINDTLAELALAAPQNFANLSVYPLIAPALRDADYLVLDQALQGKLARVTEVSEGGRPAPRQCGAVFAIDGKVAGLELFDSPGSFARYLPKIVRSYAMDAADPPKSGAAPPVEEAVRRFTRLRAPYLNNDK